MTSNFKNPNLSIVIPAYNEAVKICQTLTDVLDYTKKHWLSNEIIVVDDGSTDQTAQLVKKRFPKVRLIRLAKNQGKGAAVKKGMLSAQGKYILMMDADNEIRIHQLNKLWSLRAKADIVMGNRFSGGRRTLRWQRFILSKIGNFLFKLFFGLPYLDTQCGFKLFKRQVVRQLFFRLKNNRFAFDMEILAAAQIRGMAVVEVPIVWHPTQKFKLRMIYTGWQSFLELLNIWVSHRLNLH